MKKRVLMILATIVVVVAVAVPLSGALTGVRSQPQAASPQQMPDIPDLYTLLNYDRRVQVTLLEGTEREAVITALWARPETTQLAMAMVEKGFPFDPAYALAHGEAMLILIETDQETVELEGMTVSMISGERTGAVTAIAPPQGGEGFFQAHHTNLDPNLAEVPDPPIIVNGMPYFYVTTLRWINGQIIIWRYWWYDSHNHPNWYYAHYFWYWKYHWWWVGEPWPYWYWWVHGWYYWKYWYYWSTYFPWYMPVGVPVQ